MAFTTTGNGFKDGGSARTPPRLSGSPGHCYPINSEF
jgi:hypothetical protein